MAKRKIKCIRLLRTVCACMYLCGWASVQMMAQNPNNIRVYGTVLDESNKRTPLEFVSVSFPDYAIGTMTNEQGNYTLLNVPTGRARLQVRYLGKLPIDTIIHVTRDMELNFVLRNENFKLEEVVVTATTNEAGKATSSVISRTAMDHMQATSLYDLMSLLPGGLSTNPDLSYAQQINIRQYGSSSDAAALFNSQGTAIVKDGAPISNNANLSAMSPTVNSSSGTTSSLAGGASPSGGVDVRSISTENIESVEVIRGIPSVEYGDLTAGAVIIHTKAGREPLRVKAKANPNVYQGSVGTGFELGENKGTLNISGDYAYNTNDPVSSYRHYQRATGRALYSNAFFNNKLQTNTSLDIVYGEDTREQNPDDETTQTKSSGRDLGFTFNTNGTWNINKGWLQNIRYTLSTTYMSKQSSYQQLYSAAAIPYSMTTIDNTTLTNIAGQHLYDADGNEITNFTDADAGNFAAYVPDEYLGYYEIDSREVNVYAKVTANFFKRFGNVYNRFLVGADFKSDGNVGDGKTFNPTTPPYRSYGSNASFRPRAYKDIPFINQVGVFAEENFNWRIGERNFNIQAGVRYDHVSVAGGALSPRVNASFDVIPGWFTIRGGYGITAKMPTLLYLYPENAYFEYININELSNESIAEDERVFMTTTRVFEVNNDDLKIAKNHKAEIGFDVFWGKVKLGVTGYIERLKNGYTLGQDLTTFRPVTWNEYGRNDENEFVLTGSYPVLATYYRPTNNLFVTNKGVEFDLNFGRIDAIRTSFNLSGAWARTETYDNGYNFYDNSSGTDSYNVAIYAPKSYTRYYQQFSTTLRATHNIPRIGFVVTLTTQAVWQDADWGKYYYNDVLPIGYISKEDGSVTMFEPGQYTTAESLQEAGLGYLINPTPSRTYETKESYSPYFCFNLNLTKEISDMLRVSFFANNMFRSYPRKESKRNPGSYTTMNNRFYFGLELSLTL